MKFDGKYDWRRPPFGWLRCQLCNDNKVTHLYVVGRIKSKLGRRTYGICTACNNKKTK